MLNKIKTTVKQIKELVEAHKTLRSSVVTATELVEDVYVFVSDEHCLCSAYLTKEVIGGFAGINSFGMPIIIINNKCNDLPLAYRDAIIHHELGHIKLGHLDDGKKSSLRKRHLEKEFEADEYSHNKGYPMIETLKFMKTVFTDKKNLEEFDKRIANLSQV